MPRTARHPRQIRRVREVILDAAMVVFARKGYQAATMRQIADEAGYTAPSLYNYFAGKPQIFEALVERLDEEFLAVLEAPVPEELDFAGRVEHLVRRQVELVQRRRGAFKVFLALQGGSGGVPSERAARRHAEGYELYMERFAAWMRRATRGVPLDGRTPEDLAYALWGLSVAFQARGPRDEDPVPALLRQFLLGAVGQPPAPRRRATRAAAGTSSASRGS